MGSIVFYINCCFAVLDPKKALASESNFELMEVSYFFMAPRLYIIYIQHYLFYSKVQKGVISGNTRIIFEKAEVGYIQPCTKVCLLCETM